MAARCCPASRTRTCIPAFAGITMIGCNLIGAASLDDALARISDFARQHPDREWIAGSGWRMEWFPGGTPDRQTLDAVTGGRPAYLSNRDGHGAWANTRALELAGHRRAHPRPRGRADRARAGRQPAGHAARGRGEPGRRPAARALRRGAAHRAAAGPAAPARPRHHRLAGRHRGGLPRQPRPAAGVPGRGGQRPAHRQGRRRAVVGPDPGRRAAARHPRPPRAWPRRPGSARTP